MMPRLHEAVDRPERSSSWRARIILTVILCWIASGSAFAQEKSPCTADADASSSSACEKEVERELERTYLTILNGIRPGFPALLRNDQLPRQKILFANAQTAWKLYRDRSCEADAFENYEYSGYASVVTACRIALTRARIEQLRQGPWGVLLGEEGEVTSVEVRSDSASAAPRP
jgi:uncharacterized protein YecT (DUF1311 family)